MCIHVHVVPMCINVYIIIYTCSAHVLMCIHVHVVPMCTNVYIIIYTCSAHVLMCIHVHVVPMCINVLSAHVLMLYFLFLVTSSVDITPYETVVKQLQADLIDYSASVGMKGARFLPAQIPEGFSVTIKVTPTCNESGCGLIFINGRWRLASIH